MNTTTSKILLQPLTSKDEKTIFHDWQMGSNKEWGEKKKKKTKKDYTFYDYIQLNAVLQRKKKEQAMQDIKQ